jgi:hypothetical protein|tara:strand:- start:497 stop:673 length:177 start_codon:yes stop_codon:yes gene_type:complete
MDTDQIKENIHEDIYEELGQMTVNDFENLAEERGLELNLDEIFLELAETICKERGLYE